MLGSGVFRHQQGNNGFSDDNDDHPLLVSNSDKMTSFVRKQQAVS